MTSKTEQQQDRVKAFYAPSMQLTVYKAGYWSRDGMFYPTGPERSTREAAEADAYRRETR
jgi:hypothetical protein